MKFQNDLAFALALDEEDPLKEFRNLFLLPEINGKPQIYLLGNSLGLQPKTAQKELQKVLDQWSAYGVEGFFMGEEQWYHYHDRLTKPLAEIVGALSSEIVVMNQLTVNLHLMLASFYQPEGTKNKILCEAKAFPSDQYMLETHVKHRGLDPAKVIVEVQPREGESIIRVEDILSTIKRNAGSIALVFIGGVNYYSGQLFDIKKITAAAHAAGSMAGFDLAHAAGNVELKLHEWEVDFACWCSYKYLNSGPGAVGGVFIHQQFHEQATIPRLAGWWGYEKSTRFEMTRGFIPVPTAEGWHLSTPSMLQYATHFAALKIFEKAGMKRILRKAKLMTDFTHYLLKELTGGLKQPVMKVLTPDFPEERGCQVSLMLSRNGKQLFEKLTAEGVMTDWREPGVIRIAPVPLYNTFEEIHTCCELIKRYIIDLYE